MAISQKLPPLEPTHIHTEWSNSTAQSGSSAAASDGESSSTSMEHEEGNGEVAMAMRRASCVSRACRLTPVSLRVPPATCCKNSSTAASSSVARLGYQLASLRALLPPSARSAQGGNVIADAIRYKRVLRREIEKLQKALMPYAEQVNLKRLGTGGLQIRVSCNKEPGLLVALMESLESFGIVFANASVSCLDEKIRIDAISTKEIGERIGSLKVALMATIMRFSTKSS